MNTSNAKSWPPIWDDIFASQDWGRYPSEAIVRFMARNFYKSDRKHTKVLEVGCGPGANLWFVAREGFDAFGIDGSAVALEIAGKRLENDGLKASLTVGDIVVLPYADGFFDAVLDCECLYANNTENTRRILKEVSRVLKPGGKFCSQTFSDKMGKGGDVLEFSEFDEGPFHGKGFTRLSSLDSIETLYGKDFRISSIDAQEFTGGDRAYTISEWVVVACKE